MQVVRPFSLVLLCVLLVVPAAVRPAEAILIQATYSISAWDFHDSNGDPPQAPASNAVEGIYTFTFDTDQASQSEIVPDAVMGLDITSSAGATTDYDTDNSGVNTALNKWLGTGRITIGGTMSSVAYMVGLSNDFRLAFDIDLADYQVTSVFENLGYVTTDDPLYQALNTSVALLSAHAVPEPVSLLLLGTGLGGLSLFRRRG